MDHSDALPFHKFEPEKPQVSCSDCGKQFPEDQAVCMLDNRFLCLECFKDRNERLKARGLTSMRARGPKRILW